MYDNGVYQDLSGPFHFGDSSPNQKAAVTPPSITKSLPVSKLRQISNVDAAGMGGSKWHGGDDIWTVIWHHSTAFIRPPGQGTAHEDGTMIVKSPWWMSPKAKGQ